MLLRGDLNVQPQSPGHPTTRRFRALWEQCGFHRAGAAAEDDRRPTHLGFYWQKRHLTQKVPRRHFLGLQKHMFWMQCPKYRGGPHENIFKGLIYPFLQKHGPQGGAFYQIPPDVALTTCIQL